MTGKDSTTLTSQSSMNLTAGRTDRFANKYRKKSKLVDWNTVTQLKTTESYTTSHNKQEMKPSRKLVLRNYPTTSDVGTSHDKENGATLTHITSVLNIPNSPDYRRE